MMQLLYTQLTAPGTAPGSSPAPSPGTHWETGSHCRGWGGGYRAKSQTEESQQGGLDGFTEGLMERGDGPWPGYSHS